MTTTDSPRPRRLHRRPLVQWLVLTLPAVLMTAHSLAILPLWYSTYTLQQIEKTQGVAYVAAVPPHTFPNPAEPAIIVAEDGRPMPLPNMPGWGTVATNGGGRFSLNGDMLFFSATDNSDPRTNGRTYTLTRPTPLPRRVVKVFWLIAIFATIVYAFRSRRFLLSQLQHPPFAVPALLLFVLVLANRAWFFVDFPIVAIHPDSGSYYAVAEQIGTDTLPNFGNRPPVYPIFLRIVFSIVDKGIAMAYAQTALSFLGCLSLLYGVFLWSPAMSVPTAIGLALYLFGFTTMEHDTAMLSESVYASMLMYSFGALLSALRTGRGRWFAWSSTAMGLAILTRPGGMFLLVSYALVMLWLLWRRFGWRAIMAFAIPLPLLMIAMSTYNLRVVKAFAPSTWGEANLAVATFVYWETDPSYPPEINADIKRIQAVIQGRMDVTKKDRTILDRSWDPLQTSPIFVESFNAVALDIAQMMGGQNYETVGRQWIRRISFDSIGKHKDYYAKFVYAMLYLYFKPAPDYDFRAYLQNRANSFYVLRTFSAAKGNQFMVKLGKEYADGAPPPKLVISNADPAVPMDLAERVIIQPTPGWRIYYEITHTLRFRLFEYWAWSWAVLVGLIASLVMIVKTRFRDDAAFALFMVSVSAVGASLVVSLVEYSQPRYSYPMEWSYVICAMMLAVVLFVRPSPTRP